MNPVLRKHLEEAQRAHKITFDVVKDWDALQDLARLADVVMQVDREGDALSIRPTCEVGGVIFHRMTIGAGEWLGRVMPWFEDSDRMAILAWAYAMAGARNPDSDLWPFADSKPRLVEQLKKFAAHIGATPLELSTALNKFSEEEHTPPMPGDEAADDEPGRRSGFGGLVDLLLAEYGGTPEQWLWHTPRAQVIELCAKIGQRKRAESGTGKADPNDPRVIAGHRLVVRLQDMVESKKGAA